MGRFLSIESTLSSPFRKPVLGWVWAERFLEGRAKGLESIYDAFTDC